MLINWYSYSASPFFNFLGRAFEWSFRILQKLGVGPDVFFISAICILFITWMFMLRHYDSKGKDKGIID
ncbi:MAG: hypothetical protein ACLQQ4_11500 [Bacteroidia bacterium]